MRHTDDTEDTTAKRFMVSWDNGHAYGDLWDGLTFATEAEAERAGRDWLMEMCGIEGLDPEAADCPYAYEVHET